MLTIACVQTANYCRRGREYVRNLAASVRRNLDQPYRFVCFTDDPIVGMKGVEFEKIKTDLGGWWNKLRVFQNCTQGTTAFLDLDTIITGPLDPIFSAPTWIAALRDFFRPDGLGSGVVVWNGDHSDVWRKWKSSGAPRLPGGDQEWLEMVRPHADRLQDLCPGLICSFKANGWLREKPEGVSIVCCHGDPKPHQLTQSWVGDYWHE